MNKTAQNNLDKAEAQKKAKHIENLEKAIKYGDDKVIANAIKDMLARDERADWSKR